MDPNVCLEDIRKYIRKSYDPEAGHDERTDPDLVEIVALCEVLDVWLSMGGVLPRDWNRDY